MVSDVALITQSLLAGKLYAGTEGLTVLHSDNKEDGSALMPPFAEKAERAVLKNIRTVGFCSTGKAPLEREFSQA